MRVPDPPARRRMPPVLDISLDELPGGGPEHVLAREVWARHRERHSVLKLIAKAVGAAGLVEGRSRPDATGSVW